MRRSLAILLALVTLVLAMTGCGSSGTSTSAKEGILRAKMLEAQQKAAAQGAKSIEDYGTQATGAEKAAAIAAMRSFMEALAAKRYAKVCAGLNGKTRAALERFGAQLKRMRGKDCAGMLGASQISQRAAEARKAANATVTAVRVGANQAYVIFRPAPAGPLTYVTMKREGDSWKAAGLGAGTPLSPTTP